MSAREGSLRLLGGVCIAVACAALYLPARVTAQARRAGDAIVDPSSPAEGLDVVHRAPDGTVRLAVGRDGGLQMGIAAPNETAASRATRFAMQFGSALGMAPGSGVQVMRARRPDALGVEVVRLQQYIKGIPVTAGEMAVQVRGGAVVGVSAEVLATPIADLTPRVSAAEAVATAEGKLARSLRQPVLQQYRSSAPRLEVFNKGLLDDVATPTRLAWRVETVGFDRRQLTWVDAHSGAVLLSFNNMPHALNRSIYTKNNVAGTTLPGTLVRSEGGPAVGEADADNAYLFAGDTYTYYSTQHGRDSYDGAGAALISTVDYCPDVSNCPYQNAFWNGTQMVYGDTYASGDDVVGHELTHAVTENEAGLFYFAQSGALNESFSDIFGETIDLGNGHGNDTAGVRWLLGEDLPIGAIRNMMDPAAFGQPAKMSDSTYVCNQYYYDDGGGVHINSGIPNHAYALMVDGGSYNGQTVTGIGLTKAAKIQYRALTTYLTSGANFLDDTFALAQSCADLIGTAGITQNDCAQWQLAVEAVEMGDQASCTTPVPRLCPAGSVPSTLADYTFDSSTAGWSATAPWSSLVYPDYARSGSAAYGEDVGSIADGSLTQVTPIVLPAGARMQFAHTFAFESEYLPASPAPPTIFYDGGVVEYSTNNGASWADAAGLFSAGKGYGGVVATGFGNALGGRQAFVASSLGYVGTQYNLSSLAGQSVKFRFRIGTDSAFGDLGWLVDSVSIYTCKTQTPGDFLGTNGLAQPTVVRAAPGSLTWIVNGGPATAFGQPGDIPVAGDYDADGKTDIAVYRNGSWIFQSGAPTVAFGAASDIPVPADYNGDGKTDIAVYRPSTGYWYIRNQRSLQLGAPGDIPLPGDYVGAGWADPMVFRPSTGQWFGSIYFLPVSTTLGAPGDVPVPADYNADGVMDIAVFRPSNGTWYVGFSNGGGSGSFAWGQKGDIPVPLNMTGSAAADLVVYRPSTGTWNIRNITGGTSSVAWGTAGDVPAMLRPGQLARSILDFDADRKTDVGVYRPSNGTWYILRSITNYATSFSRAFGVSTDVPMPGDYDGDGKLDIAVFRPSTGTWYVLFSSTNYTTSLVRTYGASTDRPLVADFDGDRRADLAVFRPSTGTWYVSYSSANWTGTQLTKAFGVSTDVAAPADFDGDGKADIAVFRPGAAARWYVLRSSTNWTSGFNLAYGTTGDVPVAADYDGDRRADPAVFRAGTWFWARSSAGYATTGTAVWGVGTDVPVPGDYDGDGTGDLAVFRPSTGTWYLRGIATVAWGAATDVPLPKRP